MEIVRCFGEQFRAYHVVAKRGEYGGEVPAGFVDGGRVRMVPLCVPVADRVQHGVTRLVRDDVVHEAGVIQAPFLVEEREELEALGLLESEWVVEEERAMATLKRDFHQCLTYLEFAEEDHKAIRRMKESRTARHLLGSPDAE